MLRYVAACVLAAALGAACTAVPDPQPEARAEASRVGPAPKAVQASALRVRSDLALGMGPAVVDPHLDELRTGMLEWLTTGSPPQLVERARSLRAALATEPRFLGEAAGTVPPLAQRLADHLALEAINNARALDRELLALVPPDPMPAEWPGRERASAIVEQAVNLQRRRIRALSLAVAALGTAKQGSLLYDGALDAWLLGAGQGDPP